MTIRKAISSDAHELCVLHKLSIRELCSDDYTLEQIEAWVGGKKADDYLGPISEGRVRVAEVEGRLVGFGEFGMNEIAAVYVHPKYVQRGIGRSLFFSLVEGLRVAGCSSASLVASITSREFYLKMGCVVVSDFHVLRSGVRLPCVKMMIAIEPEPDLPVSNPASTPTAPT